MIRDGVLFSSKLFDANTGGNSTYAKYLTSGLTGIDYPYSIASSPRIKHPISYGISEATLSLFSNYEVIHFLSDTGPLFKSKRKLVTTIHGIASAHIDNVRSPRAELIWKSRINRASTISDIVITPSESSKVDLIKHLRIHEKKIRVINHGIDHKRFDKERNEFDLKLKYRHPNLPENYALYLGNLDPRKNLQTLLNAFDLEDWPKDLSLVISGRFAWGDKTILARIKDNPRIFFLGQVEDELVAALYRSATVFIFPSLYEGFGFPVLEAMACNAPVITTTRGSLKEVIGNSATILENPLDHHELMEKVQGLVNNPRLLRQLKEEGLKNAQRFDWRVSAYQHAEVYRSLIC